MTVHEHDLLVASQQANIGDGIANASNFFHRNRANAILHPQLIPDLGSIIGVPTIGRLIINTNGVTGT
jgi:hypothetical protein